MSPLSNSSSFEIISYVNDKKLSVFQKTADSSNDDPPGQQKLTEEENEKVSMPFGGGENNYMRLVVVILGVGDAWFKLNGITQKIKKTLNKLTQLEKETIPSRQRLWQHPTKSGH